MGGSDLDLADAIYASALEPALWPNALDKVSRKLGVAAATLSVSGAKAAELFPVGHERPMNEYLQAWHDKNIVASAVEKRVDGLYCDWEILSPGKIDRDPYYQEYRRGYGLRHTVGHAATFGLGQRLRFAVHMSLTGQPAESRFLDEFEAIARHVCRAFELAYRMDFQRSFIGGFADEVFRSPHAAAVLDESGQVVIANERFGSLAQDGLRIVDRRLQCTAAQQQPDLDELVQGALQPAGAGRRSLALVYRPSGKRPFVVRAVPLSRVHRESADRDGLRSSHLLVFVLDLNAEAGAGSEEALRVLGLTGTECRIATLVGAGLSPREIAEKLRLTEGTVRTRLKGMFSKLGLSRQSEITSLVTRIQMFDGTL